MTEENQTEELGWCLIPPDIMGREDLSDCDKLVYGRVLGLTGKYGYCFASNGWIGKQLGKGKDTIAHSLVKLRKLDLVFTQVERDDQKKIVKRRIFVPRMPKSAIGIAVKSNPPIAEIGIDSTAVNRVDISNNTNTIGKDKEQGTEDNPLKEVLSKRHEKEEKKTGWGSFVSQTPKGKSLYQKKERTAAYGRGVK